MSEKQRLDVYMAANGLSESREKARALILAGLVAVNGQPCDKASRTVGPDDAVALAGQSPFVSRGGLKLDEAMRAFPIRGVVQNAVCADVGASTGGFTDCLLQNGAKRVYAIDVGYGQLDWKLRSDPRVTVMERTNARFLTPAQIETPLDFACMDVAFISITLILPPLFDCLRDGGEIVALIKPQFEAGRDKVGKKGVVRDTAVHVDVIARILAFSRGAGYAVLGLHHSPITGPQGNIEFLLHLRKGGPSRWEASEDADRAEACARSAALAHGKPSDMP